MGDRDADSGRGLDRAETKKMTVTSPEIQAIGYQTATDLEQKQSRLVLFGEGRVPLAVLVMDVVQTYDLGSAVLKDYDKLEGIK
jgi:hypothetical protein